MLLRRIALAEFLGTALLLVAVVGSGTAAQRLSPGDPGLQLLASALATAAALATAILAVGPVSGAHLNPAVTLAARACRTLRSGPACIYIGAQLSGAVAGAVLANLMFSLPPVELSTTARASGGLWLGEAVAAFGLVLVVLSVVRSGRATVAPLAVAAYIGGAYFFTSSTSVANPAATVARMFTDTLAGIEPSSAPAFVMAQLVGAALAVPAARFLYPDIAATAGGVVLPGPGPVDAPSPPVRSG